MPLSRLSITFNNTLVLGGILKGLFRRYLLQRFPYGLIYAVEGQTIFVVAVMHLKRKPGYWVSRGRAK
jgi:hypothetical protein